MSAEVSHKVTVRVFCRCNVSADFSGDDREKVLGWANEALSSHSCPVSPDSAINVRCCETNCTEVAVWDIWVPALDRYHVTQSCTSHLTEMSFWGSEHVDGTQIAPVGTFMSGVAP